MRTSSGLNPIKLGGPSFDEKNEISEDLLKKMDSYDEKMIKYIKKMYDYITGEKMDLDGIMDVVSVLAKYNEKMKYNYLDVLLHPEKNKCVKIPSPIPVPSCSFQLHNCVTLSTNASGNLAFTFNPYFLYDSAMKNATVYQGTNNFTCDFLSSLNVNNASSLDGRSASDHFTAYNIGQDIPSVYSQYRLVSASVVLKYIGRLDIVSGVCGGAIVFDDNRQLSGHVVRNSDPVLPLYLQNSNFAKYGNFDLAMDSYYHQENLCLDGIRMIYFPIDNSYEEYVKLMSNGDANFVPLDTESKMVSTSEEDHYKNGFKFIGYVLGAPPSSACFKLDIFCNFECLPNPEFLNYMPSTTSDYAVSSTEKQSIIANVQKNSIMKANEVKNGIVTKSTLWSRFADKFRDKLPGILKLVGSGVLNYFFPGTMYLPKMEEEVE